MCFRRLTFSPLTTHQLGFSWSVLVLWKLQYSWGSHGATKRWCKRRSLELQLLPWCSTALDVFGRVGTHKKSPQSSAAANFSVWFRAWVSQQLRPLHFLKVCGASHPPGNYITVFPFSISILGMKFKNDLSLVPEQGFILWQSLFLFCGSGVRSGISQYCNISFAIPAAHFCFPVRIHLKQKETTFHGY